MIILAGILAAVLSVWFGHLPYTGITFIASLGLIVWGLASEVSKGGPC